MSIFTEVVLLSEIVLLYRNININFVILSFGHSSFGHSIHLDSTAQHHILFLRNFSSKERKMLPKCILIAGLGIKQIDAYKNVYGDLNLLQANQVKFYIGYSCVTTVCDNVMLMN